MRDDELERILSAGEDIVPSSSFVALVMEAVHREAARPAPIPFPWKRALPGFVAWGIALVSVVGASIEQFGRQAPPAAASLASAFEAVSARANTIGAGWVALALFLSFASVALSMRLAGGQSLRKAQAKI